jgi:hypothetical protein
MTISPPPSEIPETYHGFLLAVALLPNPPILPTSGYNHHKERIR